MKKLLLLGATGSIGVQTLDVLRWHADAYRPWGLTTHTRVELLAEQAREWGVKHLCAVDEGAAQRLRQLAPAGAQVYAGQEGLLRLCAQAAGQCDLCVAAIVGIAGLMPVAACIRAGMDILLANKETLVAGGSAIAALLGQHGRRMIPVDSEHSAIFQCIQGLTDRKELARIVLTASGGPFRGWQAEQLCAVTPQQALRHPNWDMGGKISIDSATLMNKGLEVIEAQRLFGLDADHIDVLIHPQSIVHSMVELADRSVLAQLGCADMRLPIQYALTYPARLPNPTPPLSLADVARLDFYRPDTTTFPCLQLAYDALRSGVHSCIALNAANEIAVENFLRGTIGFMDIPRIVERAMGNVPRINETSLEDVLALDAQVRAQMRPAGGNG